MTNDWLELTGLTVNGLLLPAGHYQIVNLNDIEAIYAIDEQFMLTVRDDGHHCRDDITTMMNESAEHYLIKTNQYNGVIQVNGLPGLQGKLTFENNLLKFVC